MAYKFKLDIIKSSIDATDKDYVLQNMVKQVCDEVFGIHYTDIEMKLYLSQWIQGDRESINDDRLSAKFNAPNCNFEIFIIFDRSLDDEVLLVCSYLRILRHFKNRNIDINFGGSNFHIENSIKLYFDDILKLSSHSHMIYTGFERVLASFTLEVKKDSKKNGYLSFFNPKENYFDIYIENIDNLSIRKHRLFLSMLSSFYIDQSIKDFFHYIDFDNINTHQQLEKYYNLLLINETESSVTEKDNLLSMITI